MSSASGPGSYPPPPPPFPGYPPQNIVVHVQAKSGGLTRAIMFVLGLALFAGVFILGMIFGVGSMLAGSEYQSMVLQESYRHGSGRALAIIPIEGEIDAREASFVHSAVDDVINTAKFAGVILRVNSPGGGVSASDQIWHDVERLKKAGYPVIASFGGVAASGGYYVSCGADSIVAEQTCITGSIGVIAQVLTFGGVMEKIGVQPVTIVASESPEKSTANDPFRVWTDKDKQSIRVMLDAAYDTFFDRVKTGRGSTITSDDTLHSIANGTVYTAAAAQQNGLVDSIGYLDDAIALMETRCRIPAGRANVTMLRMPLPSVLELFGAKSGTGGQRQAEQSVLDPQTLRRTMDELASPRVMYLMR